MPKKALHRYLYCWLVIALVFLLEPFTVPESPNWGYYLFGAFIDYSAILLLIPLASTMLTARLLIVTYAVYILTHFAGYLANEFSIVTLYNMYPNILFAILAIQIIIMAATGYGGIRRARRSNKGDRHIPAVVVASSFNRDQSKEGN